MVKLRYHKPNSNFTFGWAGPRNSGYGPTKVASLSVRIILKAWPPTQIGLGNSIMMSIYDLKGSVW